MTKTRTYTGTELARSTKTKLVQTIKGHDIYQHTIGHIFGEYVVISPATKTNSSRDWEAFETFQDAKRAIVIG